MENNLVEVWKLVYVNNLDQAENMLKEIVFEDKESNDLKNKIIEKVDDKLSTVKIRPLIDLMLKEPKTYDKSSYLDLYHNFQISKSYLENNIKIFNVKLLSVKCLPYFFNKKTDTDSIELFTKIMKDENAPIEPLKEIVDLYIAKIEKSISGYGKMDILTWTVVGIGVILLTYFIISTLTKKQENTILPLLMDDNE